MRLTDHKPATYPRPCAEQCGLTAAAGDIYCAGCREGVDRARDLSRSGGE